MKKEGYQQINIIVLIKKLTTQELLKMQFHGITLADIIKIKQ
ncbi:hypothetical protein [Flavobacterium sp.]|nr:hypothetical protein [Flavobacterium sp.]